MTNWPQRNHLKIHFKHRLQKTVILCYLYIVDHYAGVLLFYNQSSHIALSVVVILSQEESHAVHCI